MVGTRSNSPYSSYPSSQYPVAAGTNLSVAGTASDVASAAASTNASAPALPPLTRGGQVSLNFLPKP